MLDPDKGGYFFLTDLRAARTAALADAENADALLTAFERLGYHLTRPEKPIGLGSYKAELVGVAKRTCLHKALDLSVETLFELILDGRNDHMHVGVSARHLVAHAVQFSLLLEAGLMSGMTLVKHFMVASPTCAEHWQTVAQARQAMLLHQFSFLPYVAAETVAGERPKPPTTWPLVADHEIARYLGHDRDSRGKLFKATLSEVIPGALKIIEAPILRPSDELPPAADLKAVPYVVVAGRQLVGILTSFDLL